MTGLEEKVLDLIAFSEYNAVNGAKPKTPGESATFLWVDELSAGSGLSMSQVKGVLSSLVKKGMIEITEDVEDNLVSLTEYGIANIKGN